MSSPARVHDEHNKPVVFGLALIAGTVSLIGGIIMFIRVVPIDMNADGVPRDMNMIFTQVYSQQGLLHNERKRYTPVLAEAGVDEDTCRRYQCLMQVPPSGADYEFRLSKNGRTWFIHSISPVPKELGSPEMGPRGQEPAMKGPLRPEETTK